MDVQAVNVLGGVDGVAVGREKYGTVVSDVSAKKDEPSVDRYYGPVAPIGSGAPP